MPAIELFFDLLNIKPRALYKKEKEILEAYLFLFFYQVLSNKFENELKNYHYFDREETVLSSNFIRYVIQDILSSEIYTLSGIAYYLRIPEEVIYELLIGLNKNPSFELARKLLELHKSVRKDLYKNLLSRILG